MSSPTFKQSRLTQAIGGAMLCTALALPSALVPLAAYAQDTAQQPSQQIAQQFEVPAGGLGSALSRFAAESGVVIYFDASLTQGKQTQGLSGEHSVEGGLRELLSGSGLSLVGEADGSYRVVDTSAVMLPTVRVGSDALGATTEHTGSYTAGSTSTATRLSLSIRETPQSLTVVTNRQIKDFDLTSVDDVLDSASGVFVYNRGPNGGEYYSRGFTMQSQYDGMMNPLGISQGNQAPSPDSAILDHVEIIQGASGLLTGSGDPGGVVNMVRKMPAETFQGSVSASVGAWKYHRLEADVSGPLNETGKIRGRLVGAYQDNDTHVDYEHDNNKVVYGVLEADITSSTTVLASVQYHDWRYNEGWGVPKARDGSDLGFGRSSFFGMSGDDNNQKDHLLVTTGISQALKKDWQLQATYMHSKNNVDVASSYLIGVVDENTGDGLTALALGLERDLSSNVLDAHLKGPFSIFGREHEAFLGFNGSEDKGKFRNAINRQEVNVFAYDPENIVGPSELSDWSLTTVTRQYGFYTGGRFSVADPLTVILGSRLSWYKRDPGAGGDLTEEDSIYSPYAGVIYDLNKQVSLYASYSDIFSPQTNLNSRGSTLDPIVGANYEVGAKGEFLDGLLNSNIAIFRLEQTNLAQVDESVPFDPDNICQGSCYISVGEVVSQGVDLSLGGELPFGIQLNTSYTHQNSEYTQGEDKGDAFNTLHPKHSLRLAGTYSSPSDKWLFGAQAKFNGKIYEQGTYRDFDYRTEEGSVTLLDLMAQYRVTPNSTIKLRAENVFDKKYFESVGSTRLYNIYGSPRAFYLSYSLSL